MPNLLPFFLIATSWFGASLLAVLPYVFSAGHGRLAQALTLVLVPALFIFFFPVLAGLLSRIGVKGIVRGKFPRELMHKVYFFRRVYGACWTQVYYFKPIYSVVLAIPVFKKLVLRLFGYQGAVDFIVYPDTWIRDLPVLKISSGCYLSNRATIGTNMCLTDGSILVDAVRMDEKSMVGHLGMLAPGAKLGPRVEVGVSAAVGIRANVKEGASVKPFATVYHGAIIGKGASIGVQSYIGLKCEIGEGVHVPNGANIPDGAVIKTQQEMDHFHSSESQKLSVHKDMLAEALAKHLRYDKTS